MIKIKRACKPGETNVTDCVKEDLIEEIITTIENELDDKRNTMAKYHCEDGTVIITDIGYVVDWFEEYKDVLRRKYRK